MQTPVNISGGPLSYRYRFHEIHMHYGLNDQFGSEHSVEGYTFPAEVRSGVTLHFFMAEGWGGHSSAGVGGGVGRSSDTLFDSILVRNLGCLSTDFPL